MTRYLKRIMGRRTTPRIVLTDGTTIYPASGVKVTIIGGGGSGAGITAESGEHRSQLQNKEQALAEVAAKVNAAQ